MLKRCIYRAVAAYVHARRGSNPYPCDFGPELMEGHDFMTFSTVKNLGASYSVKSDAISGRLWKPLAIIMTLNPYRIADRPCLPIEFHDEGRFQSHR